MRWNAAENRDDELPWPLSRLHLSNPEVGLFYIAAINEAHAELAEKSLCAGKAVMCEKPVPEIMCRAFVTAIEKRCHVEKLPASVVLHEEPNEGHVITEAMLSHALEFLKEKPAVDQRRCPWAMM